MATNLAKLGFDISSRPMREASRELDRMAVSSGRAEKSSRTLASASNAVRNAVTGLIAAISVREVVQYADSWQNVANQLRQVTDGTRELTDIQGRLVNVAKDTRSNFDSTANLYARLARSTTEMGLSTEDLIGLTTTINQSFAVSGATATEASAAITQLSQGLAAGALRGEEFNSVAEQAPALLRAIGDSLDMTVGELRAFAFEGGITAQIVVDALRQASDEIDTNFNKTIATFGQNIEVARTNLMQWIGTNTAITSSVSSVGDVTVEVSENIDELATVAGAALLAWMGRLTGSATASAAAMVSKQRAIVSSAAATAKATATEISYLRAVQGSLSAQLASNTSATRAIALRQQLAANTAALTAAQSAYTAALSASTVAARAATGAMTALRGVMAFLGGPAGIALIAAGSLYYFRDALFETDVAASDAEKEVRKMAESIGEMTIAQAENQMQSLNEQMAENAIATAKAREEVERLSEKQKQQNIVNQGRPGAATAQLGNIEAELAQLEAAGQAMTEVYAELEKRKERLVASSEDQDKRRAESAAEAVQKIIDSLDAELYKLEEGERAWLARRLQLEGATGDQIKYALSVRDSIEAERAAQEQADELQRMREQADPAMAEFNRYADEIDAIEAFNIAAEEKEMLREDAFQRHWEAMAQIAEQGSDSVKELSAAGAAQMIQQQRQLSMQVVSTFGNAIGAVKGFTEQGTAEWAAMVIAQKGIMASQAIMAANLAATLALANPMIGVAPEVVAARAETIRQLGYVNAGLILAQGIGEIAGARQGGGSVQGGKSYLVGERGPEVVTMGGSGYVTPNHKLGGDSGVVVNIHNAAPGTRKEERTDSQGRQVIDVFLADMSSGGPMSKTMQSTFGLKRQGR